MFATGETPNQAFGPEFGAQPAFESLGYPLNRALWSGCLDAPSYIPQGSCGCRYVGVADEEFYGPGYVSRERRL